MTKPGLPGSHASHESLQKAVLDLLALQGIPAMPVYTGPRVAPTGAGTFVLRSNKAQRGLSDVLACLPPSGRLLLIECKTGGARRSPDQVRLQDQFRAAGAECMGVRDVLALARRIHELRAWEPQARVVRGP